MSMQVPEGKLDREAQLSLLTERLQGHQIFGRQRGRMGPIMDWLDDMIGDTDNPTEFLSQFDSSVSDFRVMANMLAVLKRDGHDLAYAELKHVLRARNSFLPGETVPVEVTRPITIVMLDPDRTMLFVNWMLMVGRHWDHEGFRRTKAFADMSPAIPKTVPSPSSTFYQKISQQMLDSFPRLAEILRRRYSSMDICYDWIGWQAYEAYYDAIEDQGLFPPAGGVGLRVEMHQHDHEIESIISTSDYSARELHFLNTYATSMIYLVEGDQATVLAQYSREQQKNITTWQINVPKDYVMNYDGHVLPYVGLHLEDEHESQKRHDKVFCSLGVNNGLGARILESYTADSQEYQVFNGRCFGRPNPEVENLHLGKPFRVLFAHYI